MENEKKLILIKHSCKVLAILLILITPIYGIPISPNNIPQDLQYRIDSNKNPVPLDNIKVPVSGISNFILNNKDKNIKSQIKALTFDKEIGNLPQDTQSIISWTKPGTTNTLVIGGSNDYRGFYGLLSGVSGYYVSNNNGTSVLREGGLPPMSGITDDNGTSFNAMSAGDPALAVSKDGTVYYSSLYQDFTGGTSTNAVGLGKAPYINLQNKSLSDSKVWSVVKIRADSGSSFQYNDKPWVGIDNSGITQNIYVTWSAFNYSQFSSKIWMARCNSSLSCTVIHNDTNPVSYSQKQAQMSKISVDSSGRVIITWLEFNYTNNPNPPYYNINFWYSVYNPGGTKILIAPKIILTLNKPVNGLNAMQGNTFSANENAWSEVGLAGSIPRMFIAYQSCGGIYLFDIPSYPYADSCSNSDTYLKYIDNYQDNNLSISNAIPLEKGSNAHSFFPTMSINQPANRVDVAWYQSENTYKHDYYLAQEQINLLSPTIITQPVSLLYASDPSADVYFNGGYIGDYFQIRTEPGSPNRVYAHYTGNPRFVLPSLYTDIFGLSIKIGGNQEDNLLNIKTY